MSKIVAYGEIMLRLSPSELNTIEDSNFFNGFYGGTESNVLVALSHLGNKTSFLSKVPQNSLGEGVKRHLLRHNVGIDYLLFGGSTLGLYFMEQGFGSKPSKVIYHRKEAVINTLKEEDFDYDKVFKDASWFHVSGISLAISENSKDVAIRLLKEAKKRNIKVSFDFNYRASLWTVDKAKSAYKEIMQYVDVCFGNKFDLINFLDLSDKNPIELLLNTYNVTYLFHTNREIINSSCHCLSAMGYYMENDKVKTICTEPEKFEVLDRIGGGDAFDAGIIHVLNNDFENVNDALQLGAKCDILKHLVKGDVLSLSNREINEWLVNQKKRDVIR